MVLDPCASVVSNAPRHPVREGHLKCTITSSVSQFNSIVGTCYSNDPTGCEPEDTAPCGQKEGTLNMACENTIRTLPNCRLVLHGILRHESLFLSFFICDGSEQTVYFA